MKKALTFCIFCFLLSYNQTFLFSLVSYIYFVWINQLNRSFCFSCKACATEVFFSSWDVFIGCINQRFWCSRILSLPYDKIEHTSRSWSQMLPPKLYLVVFYQVSLVHQTKIFCSDFRRPSEVLAVLYHMFIPRRGVVIKCSSMIVSLKDSVS